MCGRICWSRMWSWSRAAASSSLMAVWRAHGLPEILRECWEAGVVLAGASAGSLCWHRGGPTDSFGDQLAPFTDGLGLVPFSNGVHDDFADQPRRRIYRDLIASGALAGGYATEDGVGLHYVGTALHEAVSVVAGKSAPGGSSRTGQAAGPSRQCRHAWSGSAGPVTRLWLASGSGHGLAFVPCGHRCVAAPGSAGGDVLAVGGRLVEAEEEGVGDDGRGSLDGEVAERGNPCGGRAWGSRAFGGQGRRPGSSRLAGRGCGRGTARCLVRAAFSRFLAEHGAGRTARGQARAGVAELEAELPVVAPWSRSLSGEADDAGQRLGVEKQEAGGGPGAERVRGR